MRSRTFNTEVIMRKVATVLSLALLMPPLLAAQQPKFEVGTRAGFTFLTNSGDVLSFGVPGGGASPFGNALLGNSVMHVGFFPSENIMIEPQLGFGLINISDGADETFTRLILGLQGLWMASGVTTNSFYLGPNLAFSLIDANGVDAESDFAAGATLGYRSLPLDFVSVRLETHYRRWFDADVNEFGVSVVLGVVVN